jgi:hypothetical protein
MAHAGEDVPRCCASAVVRFLLCGPAARRPTEGVAPYHRGHVTARAGQAGDVRPVLAAPGGLEWLLPGQAWTGFRRGARHLLPVGRPTHRWPTVSSTSPAARPGGQARAAPTAADGQGIVWLPTDVIRTVRRRVLPASTPQTRTRSTPSAGRGDVRAHRTGGRGVRREAAHFLPHPATRIAALAPARLQAALLGTTIRACFLGRQDFSPRDLASYRGPKPQHEDQLPAAEPAQAAAWIRQAQPQLARRRGNRTSASARWVSTMPSGGRAISLGPPR